MDLDIRTTMRNKYYIQHLKDRYTILIGEKNAGNDSPLILREIEEIIKKIKQL